MDWFLNTDMVKILITWHSFIGHLILKANYQAVNASKKRTNEFVFTSMHRVFVRFLEESLARKKREIKKLQNSVHEIVECPLMKNKFIGILKNWKFTSRDLVIDITFNWETLRRHGPSDSSFTTMMTFLMQ